MLSRHFLYHCRTSAKEELEKEERERREKVAKGPKGTLGVRCFPPPLNVMRYWPLALRLPFMPCCAFCRCQNGEGQRGLPLHGGGEM